MVGCLGQQHAAGPPLHGGYGPLDQFLFHEIDLGVLTAQHGDVARLDLPPSAGGRFIWDGNPALEEIRDRRRGVPGHDAAGIVDVEPLACRDGVFGGRGLR